MSSFQRPTAALISQASLRSAAGSREMARTAVRNGCAVSEPGRQVEFFAGPPRRRITQAVRPVASAARGTSFASATPDSRRSCGRAQAEGGARGGAAQGRWVGPERLPTQAVRAWRTDAGHVIVVTVLMMRSSGLSSWSAPWLIELSEMSWVEFPRATRDHAASAFVNEAGDAGAPTLAEGVPHQKTSARTAGIKPKNARRSMRSLAKPR